MHAIRRNAVALDEIRGGRAITDVSICRWTIRKASLPQAHGVPPSGLRT